MREKISVVIRIETSLGVASWGLWMNSITMYWILSLSSVQELRDDRETIDLLQMTHKMVSKIILLAKGRELQIDNSLTHQQAYLNPSVMKLILFLISSAMPLNSVPNGLEFKLEREEEKFL